MLAKFEPSHNQNLQAEIEKAVLFALCPSEEPALLQSISNWEEVSRFLISRKLAGRFFHRLRANSCLELVPEPFALELEKAYQLFVIKNKLFLEELERIWKALKKEINQIMIFKGIGLLLSGFYQLGERYQVDIDFLVSDYPREKLCFLVQELDYIPTEHSDQFWWSEEHFVLKGSRGAGDVFSVFLEFHWEFKPINHTSGRELVWALFNHQEIIDRQNQRYVVPNPEMQFYLSAIHGSAFHPFDSSYFWVSLMDLSTISSQKKLNLDLIIPLAQTQGLTEHLGIMIYLLWEKLGGEESIWEKFQQALEQKKLVIKTAQKLWEAFLKPQPLSLTNLSLLLAKTSWKEKLKALKEFSGLSSGEEIKAEEKTITFQRPSFFNLFKRRLKLLADKEFLSLIWQMARFYRKTDFRPIL